MSESQENTKSSKHRINSIWSPAVSSLLLDEWAAGVETIMWTCVNYGCLLWWGKYETWIWMQPREIKRAASTNQELGAKHHPVIMFGSDLMGERRITLRAEARSADPSPSRLQQSLPGHRNMSSRSLQTRGKDDIVLRWESLLKQHLIVNSYINLSMVYTLTAAAITL